jgi:hypothetical protein
VAAFSKPNRGQVDPSVPCRRLYLVKKINSSNFNRTSAKASIAPHIWG